MTPALLAGARVVAGDVAAADAAAELQARCEGGAAIDRDPDGIPPGGPILAPSLGGGPEGAPLSSVLPEQCFVQAAPAPRPRTAPPDAELPSAGAILDKYRLEEEVELVGPRAQPVLLVWQRALHVGVGRACHAVEAGARGRALGGVERRRGNGLRREERDRSSSFAPAPESGHSRQDHLPRRGGAPAAWKRS